MPSAALYLAVPTVRSLNGLVQGPVFGWKAMLTVAPPIGDTGYLMVPVVLVGLFSVLASMAVSLRSGRPALAALPLVVALVVAFLLGVNTTYAPVGVGLAALQLEIVALRHQLHADGVSSRDRLQRQQLLAGTLGR